MAWSSVLGFVHIQKQMQKTPQSFFNFYRKTCFKLLEHDLWLPLHIVITSLTHIHKGREIKYLHLAVQGGKKKKKDVEYWWKTNDRLVFGSLLKIQTTSRLWGWKERNICQRHLVCQSFAITVRRKLFNKHSQLVQAAKEPRKTKTSYIN